MSKIDELIERIVTTVQEHPEWNRNKALRYIYLEVGKNIHKNADFFYSLYGVLKERNFNIKQIQELYTTEALTDSVICRDSARLLKAIFDRLGYENKIIDFYLRDEDTYTLPDGNRIGIRHTCITVKGDNDKNIFLTINNDLSAIQTGMKTNLFGNHMTYRDPKTGKPLYEGEEVESYVLSDEEILKYDIELGYATRFPDKDGKPVYGYINTALHNLRKLAQDINKNTEFLSNNEYNPFYMNLIKLLNTASGSNLTECLDMTFSKISDEAWEEIKDFIVKSIIRRVEEYYKVTFSQEELNEVYYLYYRKDYRTCLNQLKEILATKDIKDIYDKSLGYEAFIGQGLSFLKNIDLIMKTDFSKRDKSVLTARNKFMTSVNKLTKFFVKPELIIPKDYQYSNEYIVNKLMIAGPDIFDYGSSTCLSQMRIAEKVSIINKILDNLFYELKNDVVMDAPEDGQKGFLNRVYTASLYNKETDKYDYLLYIKATDNEDDKVLIFDFEQNKIIGINEPISLAKLELPTSKYIVVSNYLSTFTEEEVRKKRV